MSRRDSLEKAINANRGHLIAADWSIALSEACGVEIGKDRFLAVDITVELKRAVFEKLRNHGNTIRTQFWRKEQFEDVESYLSALSSRVHDLRVILFSSVDESIGAVILPADCILSRVKVVWTMVGEDLCLTTEDLQHGLCLEENFYGDKGEYVRDGVYELATWGAFSEAIVIDSSKE